MPQTEPRTDDSSDSLIGQVINERYRLQLCLSPRDNSPVYKVQDLSDSTIKCLKLIKSYRTENLQHFMSEAERLKTEIRHPALAKLHDFGVLNGPDELNNCVFMVFDYIIGRSLHSLLNRKGRIGANETVSKFIQLCELFKHLHAAGISCIQPSPRRIMLSEQSGMIHLSDPGLSYILFQINAEPEAENSKFPEEILYLSPEQCSGLSGDQRSDIYSVGCILYESLLGLPPFLSKSPYEVSRMHIKEEAKPLRMSRDDLNFPLELDLLVLKSLRKNPNQRQQSMGELLEDLRRVQEEMDKMPELSRADSGGSRNIILQTMEDLTDLLGINQGLKLKLAIPVILGIFILLGSIAIGNYLKSHSLKEDSSSESERLFQNYASEGKARFESGDYAGAENSYKRALSIAEKFGIKDRRFLLTLNDLRNVYDQEKRPEKVDELEARLRSIMSADSAEQ